LAKLLFCAVDQGPGSRGTAGAEWSRTLRLFGRFQIGGPTTWGTICRWGDEHGPGSRGAPLHGCRPWPARIRQGSSAVPAWARQRRRGGKEQQGKCRSHGKLTLGEALRRAGVSGWPATAKKPAQGARRCRKARSRGGPVHSTQSAGPSSHEGAGPTMVGQSPRG